MGKYDDWTQSNDPFADTRAAMEDGISRAEMGAPEEWKLAAAQAITKCARELPEFTADEVWIELAKWGVPPPKTPAALGPCFLEAKRHNVIVDTGRFRPLSLFARRHRRLTIWRMA